MLCGRPPRHTREVDRAVAMAVLERLLLPSALTRAPSRLRVPPLRPHRRAGPSRRERATAEEERPQSWVAERSAENSAALAAVHSLSGCRRRRAAGRQAASRWQALGGSGPRLPAEPPPHIAPSPARLESQPLARLHRRATRHPVPCGSTSCRALLCPATRAQARSIR